jgi:hypothetical protein
MSIFERQVENGVNVQALLDARKALSDAPEAAKFQWRASCKWINGTHSRSTIRNFFGLGGEQKHRTEFSFDADHPEIFASEDKGPTPVEYVLVGLTSCLTAGIAAVAQTAEFNCALSRPRSKARWTCKVSLVSTKMCEMDLMVSR